MNGRAAYIPKWLIQFNSILQHKKEAAHLVYSSTRQAAHVHKEGSGTFISATYLLVSATRSIDENPKWNHDQTSFSVKTRVWWCTVV